MRKRALAIVLCLLLGFTVKPRKARADENATGMAVSVTCLLAGIGLTPFGLWFGVNGINKKQNLNAAFGIITGVVGSAAFFGGLFGIVTFNGLQTGNNTTVVTTGLTNMPPNNLPLLPPTLRFMPNIAPVRGGVIVGATFTF